MYMPNNNELRSNLDSKTLVFICTILINCKKTSYDYNATKKAFYKLQHEKVLQYGYLIETASYCASICKYFEDKLAANLMREVASNIFKFANNYEYLLV